MNYHAWKLAWRNLGRNKRRTLSTACMVIFAFVGIVLVTGYTQRVRHFLAVGQIYARGQGHLGIYAQDGLDRYLTGQARYTLDEAQIGTIASVLEKQPEVAMFGRQLHGAGLAQGAHKRGVPFMLVASDSALDRYVRRHPMVQRTMPDNVNMSAGKTPDDDPLVSGASVALSEGLAQLLGWQADNAVGHQVQLLSGSAEGGIGLGEAVVTGTFQTGAAALESRLLVASYATAQEILATDRVSRVAVLLNDEKLDPHAMATSIQSLLREAGAAVDVFSWNGPELGVDYLGFCGLLRVISTFMYAVLVSVVLFAALNLSIVNVNERRQEIGTLLAVGLPKNLIRGVFLRESILLAAGGNLLGAIVAFSLVAIVNAANFRFSPPGTVGTIQFLLTPNLAAYAGAAALLLLSVSTATAWGTRHGMRAGIIEILNKPSC